MFDSVLVVRARCGYDNVFVIKRFVRGKIMKKHNYTVCDLHRYHSFMTGGSVHTD